MQGIDYMHSMGMTHGDIKPDNLLLGADGRVRICDFGSAQKSGPDDVMIRTVGTPAFFSPEMCDGRPYSARGADVWALGICLYTFVFGELCPMAWPFGVCLNPGVACESINHSMGTWHLPLYLSELYRHYERAST